MGQIVKASCAACGFDESVEIGGGMLDFQTHSYFPYLCEVCGMISANIAEQPVVCPADPKHSISRYGSCVSDRMVIDSSEDVQKQSPPTWLERIGLKKRKLEKPKPRYVESPICRWDDHEILFGAYECPACHKKNLFFEATVSFFD